MAKTLEQKLCKRSRGYAAFRNIMVRPALFLYYRKVDIIGVETVPDTGPIIFTPNHQNALMDALAVLCTKNRQPVFVARADIFQKPLIIAALHFLRILPIYRKRDGGSSSDNNHETFDLILKTLHSGQAVGIMPEGVHTKIKRLQMLQKGVFRLAMQAQEKYGSSPMIKIVPVGIEYTSTNKFRSDLMIKYGKAIDVSDFYDLYAENPARAFKQMQNALMEKMRGEMIDIAGDQYYIEVERLRLMYQRKAAQRLGLNYRKAEHRLQTQQKIIAILQNYEQTNPDEMSALCLTVRNYFDIIREQNMNDWVIEGQPYSLVGLLGRILLVLLGIPFCILGMMFNYLPYRLSSFASRKVKDPQFVSSVQFVAGLALFPLYHFIMTVLLVIFIPCIWGKIIMPLLLVPLGIIAWMHVLLTKNIGTIFRFRSAKREKKSKIHEAIELRKNIFEKMEKIEMVVIE